MTCSNVHTDSKPTASACRARPTIASTDGMPMLTGIRPSFMRASADIRDERPPCLDGLRVAILQSHRELQLVQRAIDATAREQLVVRSHLFHLAVLQHEHAIAFL